MSEYIKRSGWIAAVLSGCMMVVSTAQAASFDCAKAATKVEKLICGDTELSKLDEELNAAYKIALKDEKQANSMRQAQKQWMMERNGCVDAVCVKGAYDVWLKTLNMNDQSTESDKAGMIASLAQTDKPKLAEQALPQTPPKLRYAFCDKSKPELYCEGQTGKGYTVCETYLKHLQTLTSPPTCEAPIPPGFQQPDWEEMDVTLHLDLAYQAEEFFLKRSGYKHPDFEVWRQTFLQEIKEGKITPRMRRAKVTPNDKGDVTILAYTRDKDACHKSYEWEKRRKVQIDQLPDGTSAWSIAKQLPGYPDPYWRNQGDAHFTLWDDMPSKLEIIGGDVSRDQKELMIYAGKAYLVQVFNPLASIYKPRWGKPYSPVVIYAFDLAFPDRIQLHLKLDRYFAVNALCQLLPY